MGIPRKSRRPLPINHVDVGVLLQIIDENWSLFEPSLIRRQAWTARMQELRSVRNRLAHCRAPRPDDQGRIEALLRDLEAGAWRSASAHNDDSYPDHDLDDPIARDWIRRGHEVAQRLIPHGARAYGVNFHLSYTARPWAEPVTPSQTISGMKGWIWQWWATAGEGRWIDPRRYWESDYVQKVAPAILHVIITDPWSIRVTFPAVDDPATVSDAIAWTFEALLVEASYGVPDTPESVDQLAAWVRDSVKWLDSRVIANHPFALVDPNLARSSIFDP